MNKARTLAQSIHFRRTGKQLPMNDVLETVFALMDHYNDLHFHDRDRHHERITGLEEKCRAEPPR